MDPEYFRNEMNRLRRLIEELPAEQCAELTSLARDTELRHAAIRADAEAARRQLATLQKNNEHLHAKLVAIQDSLSDLNLNLKYMQFDLEVRAREQSNPD